MEEKKTQSPPAEAQESEPRKTRRHGYRGYPVGREGGRVHWGRGFSGVEPLNTGPTALPRAGILTEESTRDTR